MVNSEIHKYFNFPEAKLVTAQLFQKALNSSGGTVGHINKMLYSSQQVLLLKSWHFTSQLSSRESLP